MWRTILFLPLFFVVCIHIHIEQGQQRECYTVPNQLY